MTKKEKLIAEIAQLKEKADDIQFNSFQCRLDMDLLAEYIDGIGYSFYNYPHTPKQAKAVAKWINGLEGK